jgi:hypothetical protein
VKRALAVALALTALAGRTGSAQNAPAPEANVAAAQDVTLALPRALRAGETAAVEVQLGPISRGSVLNVTTASGQPLGTISPFGARPGQEAGTYTLPIPPDAIRDGRLAIRLTVSRSNAPPRAPTAQEVRGVKLTVGGAGR